MKISLDSHHKITNHRLFVVGPYYTEEEISSSKTNSPAAAAWMRGFLKILSRFVNIKSSFWFEMEKAWPAGRLLIGRKELSEKEWRRTLVAYINLPKIKRHLISKSLSRELLSNVSKTDFVIVYGQRTLTPQHFANVAQQVSRIFLIVPDANPGQRGMREINAVAKHATGGVICLPAELSNALRDFHTLSLQGAVSFSDLHSPALPLGKRKFVFIGGVDKFSGAHFLRQALELVELKNCDIVVIGRIGDPIEAAKLRELGARVTGFLDYPDIERECLGAFAFLNPRDPQLSFSACNFPSKLLLYMRFKRPIVSTDTEGLPRTLAEALDCCGVRTPHEFAQKLEKMSVTDEIQVKYNLKKIVHLIEREYSEDAVAKRLQQFIFG